MQVIKFCVVIPAHNSDSTISETLRSVSRQTYTNFRVVVVNNGSTDSTSCVASSWSAYFASFSLLHFDETLGPGEARNAGTSTCHDEWIAFCDSDDLWTPDHLAMVANSIQKNQQPRLLATKSLRLPAWAASGLGAPKLHVWRLRKRHKIRTGNFFDLLPVFTFGLTPFHTPSVVVHSRILAEVGGFAPEMTGEDIHLWMRIGRSVPIELICARTSVIIRRRHGISSSVRKELNRITAGERIDSAARNWLVPRYLTGLSTTAETEAKQIRGYLDRLVLVQWRGILVRGQCVSGIRGLARHQVRWGFPRIFVSVVLVLSLPACLALRTVRRLLGRRHAPL